MKPSLLPLVLALSTTAAFADDIGVKVRLGLEDKEATDWSGTVSVTPGSVSLIGGWRFAQQDKVDGTSGWACRTRPNTVANRRRSNNPGKEATRPANAVTSLPLGDNGVLITFTGVTEDSHVTIKTKQGEFTFAFSEITPGKIVPELNGAVEVERTAAAQTFTTDAKTDEDYPSGAVAADGTVWTAWQSFTPGLDRAERARSYDKEPADLKFLATPPGGDQLWLRPLNGEAIAITQTGRDIYKSAVAVDGRGLVWVIWAENAGYKPFPDNPRSNFDIFARSYDPKTKKLSEPAQLSDSPENDVWPVAATDSDGHVWVAWQGARENVFHIFQRHQTKDGWSPAEPVSTQKRNCWAPAIATTAGKVAIAWDTYEKGDYDVWMREFAAGKASDARPVADTPDYEARPAMTYDKTGALWIAWEKSGPTWGKDWGALVKDKGIPLYRDRQIGLAVLKDGQWMEPEGSFKPVLPGAGGPRKRQRNARVPALEPGAESRKAGQEAEATKNFPHNNLARIVCDKGGRIWLFCRSRQNDFRTPLGSLWFDWACYTDGDHWTGPLLMPHSDNLMYNVPVVLPTGEGLTMVHSSDHRQDRHIVKRGNGPGGNLSLEAENDPYDNDLYVSHLQATGPAQAAKLIAAKVQPDPQAGPSPATVKEREDIANVHAYRTEFDGKKLQIERGEFHRHTEISGDGGNDGPLEDMWRYAIDVAGMDWLGCGDHDNGAGREYPWWLTQKTTDAFYLPGAFNALYTYERSVRYPEGHRNVIFTRRGIRTLPRLPISLRDNPAPAPDTLMLYKYLHFFHGICASHTSATDMGTDWRNNDPQVEPFVEIYQGARQNYERPGAPRSPTADDAIGGWEPLGFVNLALKKGYRLSFESSSDHGSTHISYALAYAENSSREAIFNAMQARHVYASTTNIVADFRCGPHMMGDEFTTSEAPKFKIHLEGTGAFSKVVFVKDDEEIFTATPNSQKCDVEWTDPKPAAGQTSYYYVRGEQANGELVWASPMWIKFEPKK
ncbi:hypothetical protein CfE428DRAFT_5247 [Chthoniobacter flavus Ellin428]|uniref:Uncharacterized protein n=1 Tax=Chthoniobacter flavus Ellin428 TaxID=497964 RepID=B4D8K7_9BACT|nr:DUF3604 domain-containing protein [Chthoniobacter flavus]EDY17229.1 hypothetical protein CfE428DRAFT_5247 [Chthoniobacter flavus Ellin428]TCO86945.1 hypothetical protein EV701_12540 [Chthoniobacter flavus]